MFEDVADAAESVGKNWWLALVVGVLWLIYGFVVLSASASSVAAVAVLFGIGFIAGGVIELGVASMVNSWKWLHAIFGVVAIIAGITAMVWPGATFVVLAAIIAWYLMFDGMFWTIGSIAGRSENDLWWLGMITGILEIGLGVWALGYSGRSVALLLIWVGVAAITRGISDIVLGLSVHGADRNVRAALGG